MTQAHRKGGKIEDRKIISETLMKIENSTVGIILNLVLKWAGFEQRTKTLSAHIPFVRLGHV